MGQRTYMFDALMQTSDGLTAYTTAQISKVAAANKIIDLGGALTRTDIGLVGGMSRLDAALVIDVSAITNAATNVYDIFIMGSNIAAGTSPAVLGGIRLGNTAVMPNGGATAGVGRYELLFSTEQADINYEYLYLWVVPQGNTPSINFTAFVSPLPEI